MSRIHTYPLACALTAATVVLASAGSVAAEERCYGDWSDAAPVVVSERLRSARDVHDLARDRHDSDVVRIVLCRVADDYVYRVVLRRSDGRIGKLTVSAASLAVR